MDAERLGIFKERLLRLRDELAARVDGFNRTLDEGLKDATGEVSSYDNHPADVGSETFERSKDFALREDAVLKLRAVAEALEKIDAGTYGTCDVCGGVIPEERLAVMPYTTLCRTCKEALETREWRRDRPVEEAVIRETAFPTLDEGVIYDAEDAWQDVLQHGPSTETEPLESERRGFVEDVDSIPYVKDDGVFYRET
ncbi:MAG: TraR/DksA C4-type zinc finger protein [Bacillota bacterium]